MYGQLVKQPSDSACLNEDEWASLKELATLVFDVEGEECVLLFGELTRAAGIAVMYPDEPAYVMYDEVAAQYVRQVKMEFDDNV